MKKIYSVNLDDSLVNKAREILNKPPKQSLSSFIENKLYQLIGANELTNKEQE